MMNDIWIKQASKNNLRICTVACSRYIEVHLYSSPCLMQFMWVGEPKFRKDTIENLQ